MARILFACLIAATALTAIAQTTPRVEVLFVQPEKFTDLGTPPASDRMRDQILAEIRSHLVNRASARVPTGQKLSIAITDVDQAGGFEPLRKPDAGRVRIYRDVYPPRAVLEFKLTDTGDKVVAEGKRALSDMTYLGYVGNRNDPLRYEKKLFDDWLEREFPASPGPK